jgi:hypothetical protein
MKRQELLNQILFRRQAEELAKMSPQAFQKHISKGHIVPAKEHGIGKGKAQLFWKKDVENLKIGKYKEVIKMKNLKESVKEAIRRGAYVVVFKDREGYVCESVAENGRDSFRMYNEVVAEYDFTDRIITDGVKTIEPNHPEYEAYLIGEAEYQAEELLLEFKDHSHF